MDLNLDIYPRTNVNGELEFTRTVSLDSMRTAVGTQLTVQDLDFSNITFVIKGVPNAQSDLQAQNRGTTGAQNITAGCAKLQETPVRN